MYSQKKRIVENLCYYINETKVESNTSDSYDMELVGFKNKIPVLDKTKSNEGSPQQTPGKKFVLKTDSSGKKFLVVNGKKVELRELIQKPQANGLKVQPTNNQSNVLHHTTVNTTSKDKIRLENKSCTPKLVSLPNKFFKLVNDANLKKGGSTHCSTVMRHGGKAYRDAQTSTHDLIITSNSHVQTDPDANGHPFELIKVENFCSRQNKEAEGLSPSPVWTSDDEMSLLSGKNMIVGKNVSLGCGPAPPVIRPYEPQISIECVPQSATAQSRDMQLKDKVKEKFFTDLENCTLFDVSGNMPIHLAIMQDNIAAVKKQCVLLRHREQTINFNNIAGHSILQLAIMHDSDPAIVQTLLDEGGDFSILDNDGNSLIHLAVLNSNMALLRALLKNIKVFRTDIINSYNYEGFTPLMICAQNNQKDLAMELLKNGAEPNIRDNKSGRTALFHAVENNDVEMVQLLLDNNSDPKVRNFFGMSPHDAMFEIDNLSQAITKLIVAQNILNAKKKKGEKRKNVEEQRVVEKTAAPKVKIQMTKKYVKVYVNNKKQLKNC